jgi:hypothetical protein
MVMNSGLQDARDDDQRILGKTGLHSQAGRFNHMATLLAQLFTSVLFCFETKLQCVASRESNHFFL